MEGMFFLGVGFFLIVMALLLLRVAHQMLEDANHKLRSAAEAYAAATHLVDRADAVVRDTRQLELMLTGGKMNDD